MMPYGKVVDVSPWKIIPHSQTLSRSGIRSVLQNCCPKARVELTREVNFFRWFCRRNKEWNGIYLMSHLDKY